MTTARREDESFEDYKARQKIETALLKEQKKGTLFHNSEVDGTYFNYDKKDRKMAKLIKHKKGN